MRGVFFSLLALTVFAGGASARPENVRQADAAVRSDISDHSEIGSPFVDRFQGIDRQRWRLSDGWDNGPWIANDWRAAQVGHFPDGVHVVLARNRRGAKRFSSGEMQTHTLYQFGYFETRMQAPRGSGLVTGFFTYNRPEGENSWDEIDVEILGRDTHSVQFSYFRNGARNQVTVPLGFDAAAGFHTYGFDWRHERIRWYVDGVMVHEVTGAGVPSERPQRLLLSLWNSSQLTEWVGPIVPWEGPWTLRVSCVAQAESYTGRQLCA